MLRFNVKCLLIFSILCYLTRPVLSDCRNAFIPDFDYFPNKVYFDSTGESNADFNVAYYNSYIIVTNNIISFPETYVLYCTAEQPVLTNVPANSTNYIQIPVTNVAVSDRSIISFLEILGEEESIKYVSDKSAITSPCLQQNNNLYETLNFANSTQLASVDVVFTNTPLMGGKYVQVSFDEDTQALRKAEWIKFVSLFFNQTTVANEIFGKIQSNYLCHLDNLSYIPKQKRKTIAWVSLESDFTFTVKYSSFYQNVTEDAGGYALIPQITNIQTTDELHQSIDEAYIVIDMSDLTAPHNTLDSWKHYFGYDNVTTLPKFLKEKRLFRTHKLLNNNGYDDWTESSGPRPDLILQDLIAIQYPSYQPDYTVRWFDKFAETGDIVIISGDQCDISAFGSPKTDFGTCVPFAFNGKNGHKHNNNNKNKKEKEKKKVKTAIIIASSVVGSLVLLGLGAWSLVVARRKYRERFVKLRDEPVVQMNSVKEVQLESAKEVK